jgi:hypothetical protein
MLDRSIEEDRSMSLIQFIAFNGFQAFHLRRVRRSAVIACLCSLLVFLFGGPPAAALEMDEESLEMTIFGGGFFSGNAYLGDNPGTGIRLTYNFTEMFGLEGTLGFIPISSYYYTSWYDYMRLDSNAVFYSADAVVHVYNSRVVPFVAAGVGGTTFRFSETVNTPYGWASRTKSDTYFAVNYGGGVKILLSHTIALRIDVRGYRIFTGREDRADPFGQSGGWAFGGEDINLLEAGGGVTFIF